MSSNNGLNGKQHFWMADEACTKCYDCGRQFSLFVRRHHCRLCGQIFCNPCSSSRIPGAKIGSKESLVRVCNYCFKNQYSKTSKKKTTNNGGNNNSGGDIRSSNNALTTSVNGITSTLSVRSLRSTLEKSVISNLLKQQDEQSPKPTSPPQTPQLEPPEIDPIDLSNPTSNEWLADLTNIQPKSVEMGTSDSDSNSELLLEYPRSIRRTSAISSFLNLFGKQSSTIIRRESLSRIKKSKKERALEFENLKYEDQLQYRADRYHEKLIKFLLEKNNITTDWYKTINKLTKKALLQLMDCTKLDPLKHVFTFITPTGNVNDSRCITGVVFRNHITHKTMKNMIANPKLLLFGCGIEFERVEGKFSELDTLREQEQSYIEIIVARIISLKPDIVLVEKSVCRIAFDMLIQAQITVITNVPHSILERISRLISISILPSISQLQQPLTDSASNSKSERFSTYYADPVTYGDGDKETLFIFEGCTKKLGCNIILRGSENREQLKLIKKIVLFSIYAAYNAKREVALCADEGLSSSFLDTIIENQIINPSPSLSCNQSIVPVNNQPNPSSSTSANNSNSNLSIVANTSNNNLAASTNLSASTLLSLSSPLTPTHSIEKPPSEIDCGLIESEEKKKMATGQWKMKHGIDLDCIECHTNKQRWPNEYLSCSPQIFYPQKRDISKDNLLSKWPILSIDQTLLQMNFRTNMNTTASLSSLFRKEINYPTIFHFKSNAQSNKQPQITTGQGTGAQPQNTALEYQSISYLHSLCCRETGMQCIPFSLQKIKYYKEASDYTLGNFLYKFCFAEEKCKIPECANSLLEHERTIIHNRGRITFVAEKTKPSDELFLTSITGENTIIYWSYCSKCNVRTNYTHMSKESLNYSFGKWLEHTFYYQGAVSQHLPCTHSVLREHIRYFMYSGIVVAVSYEPLGLYNILLPPLQVYYATASRTLARNTQVEVIEATIRKIYETIELQIDEMEATLKKHEDMKHLEELRLSLEEEQKMIFTRFESVKESSPEEEYELNRFKRILFVNTITWNSTIHELLMKRISTAKTRRTAISYVANQQANFDPISVMYTAQTQPLNQVRSRSSFLHTSSANTTQPSYFPTLSTSPSMSLLDNTPLFLRSSSNTMGRAQSVMFQTTPVPNVIPNFEELSSTPPNGRVLAPALRVSVATLPVRNDPGTSNSLSSFSTLSSAKSFETNPMEAFKRKVSPRHPDDLPSSANHLSSPSSTNLSTSFEQAATLSNGNSPSSSTNTVAFSINSFSTVQLNRTGSYPSKDYRTVPALSDTSSQATDEELNENEILFEQAGNSLNNSASALATSEFEPCTDFNLVFDEGSSDEENDDFDLPALGNSPSKSTQGKNRVSTLDGLRNILPNLPSNVSPATLTPAFLRDASGLFHPDGMDDAVIVISEQEPSSIIAYALMSKEYNEHIALKLSEINSNQQSNHIDVDSSFIPLISDLNTTFEIKIGATHTESRTKCTVTIYHAVQFQTLRKVSNTEDIFVRSITHSARWKASGGRSNSSWEKSLDERFVIKRLPKVESEAFITLAFLYFKHLAKAYCYHVPTLLAKILGVYTINYRSVNKSIKHDVIVMENLFYEKMITKIYDLKGSLRNRLVETTPNTVLLDENLLNEIFQYPLCVDEHSKALITIAVWNDSLFLSQLHVMDYSLIVGIEEKTQTLVIGIIDYIRQYTLDKQIEKLVKSTQGSQPPTVIAPKDYKARFRSAMWNYFVMVPDTFSEYYHPSSNKNFSPTWDQVLTDSENKARNKSKTHRKFTKRK